MDLVTYWQRFVAPFIRARLVKSERGASMVEYALLLALIAVVCIVAVGLIGTKASSKFNTVANSLS